jgi:glycerol-3-phosphate dehydrogenase subunit C
VSEEAKRKISYQPTDGLSYDPTEAKYWDEDALDAEIERVFEVCNGCRMCFKYCDAFPILFSAIDKDHGGKVHELTPLDTQRVMDACFQCKLCEVQCPYTPRDGHEFQLDFPKLVHRYDAIRHRKREQPHKLRLKLLEDPDRASAMARASLGVANAMNRVGIHRWFMEKLVGIDRRKLLPDFAQTTFESWAKGAGFMDKGVGGEAVIFQTCYVQGNEPQIGMDTIEVLEKNGVDVRCEKGLECCGMPAWEGGNLELLRKKAHANLDRLIPHVKAGAKVIAQPDLLDDAAPRIPRATRRGRPRARQRARRGSGGPQRVPLVDPKRAAVQYRVQEHTRKRGCLSCALPPAHSGDWIQRARSPS